MPDVILEPIIIRDTVWVGSIDTLIIRDSVFFYYHSRDTVWMNLDESLWEVGTTFNIRRKVGTPSVGVHNLEGILLDPIGDQVAIDGLLYNIQDGTDMIFNDRMKLRRVIELTPATKK